MNAYGARPLKRHRSTKADLANLDQLIIDVIEQDHPVTLRGVYYRVMSAGGVPKTEAAYRAVGRRLLALRRDGRVPYDRITDGTRWVFAPTTFDSVEDALMSTARLYRRNLWRDLPVDVHMYTEKDAISGVITPETMAWGVPLGVVRGYCSETFAYSVARSIAASRKPTFVYQLGDHDPSGVGAWEDFQAKIIAFAPDATVTFKRLAVTEEQIEEHGLQTRHTKESDTRTRHFEGESVEVDAIPAPTLRQIVFEAITQHIDQQRLAVMKAVEESERSVIWDLADASHVRP